MGNQHTLAGQAEDPLPPSSTTETFIPPSQTRSGRVNTSRPSYSFSKSGSAVTRSGSKSRSSSPKKRTGTTTPLIKTTTQELSSNSHKKAHVDAVTKSTTFRSKTSLTPRSIELLNTFNNTPSSPIHALNFSATSGTPSVSSSTIHATGELQVPPAVESQPLSSPPSETSLRSLLPPTSPVAHPTVEKMTTIEETEGERSGYARLGMERGFEHSPMAKLIREFTSVDDDSQRIPTATNVTFFLSLTELSPEMVVDRGVNRDKGLPRYLLETSNLQLTEIVVTELQIFIQQASGLIAERKSFFIVDPGDTMMSILRGTSSLAQLNAAWSALRSRVELGMKAWKKYGVEYQHSPEERPVLSPLSTLPELYTPLSDIEGDEQRLRYLFTHIPHHKEQLSSEGYSALQKTRSWVHILPLPDSLKDAFVNDQKEDNGPNPAVSNSEAHLDKGKAKASIHSRRRGKDTITTTNDPVPSGSSNSIWMGMDTPFKGANKWFVDNNKSNRSRQPGTSRAQGEDTNILLGIATPLPPKTTTIKDWGDRERPPHQPDPKVTNVATSVRSDASHNKGRKDQRDRTGGDSPEDGSSDGSSTVSSRSRRSNRAGRRRRRSTTPRPRRRSSSTPRPRRRRPAPDDDGGSESSGDGDGSSFSSDSSSWDSEYTSSSRRSRHRSRRAKVSAPYGNSIPTIDSKLKQEDLPTWDGNPSTAIQYFWRVQQCATLGGYIPAALGYWLWLKLKEGSDVQTWFATLPFAEQSRMRGHWVDYLKGIKEGYLGRTWQFDIGEEYKNQYFRQPGFERELPKSFIARHENETLAAYG